MADDRPTLLTDVMTRRRALLTLGGAGLAAVVAAACGSDGDSGSAGGSTSSTASTDATTDASTDATTDATTDGSCTQIPEETAGPFPGDGSNGPDVLTADGVVREDITSSFGEYSGTADGVALAMRLRLVDSTTCAPLAGAAVYAWHCDAEGRYSLYSDGATDQNYLRGVQVSDADGLVTFTSVFPGCYPGRWPHVHFEVFESLDAATSGGPVLRTSQLAFPQRECEAAYTDSRYPGSASSLAELSLATDGVFSDDGGVHQLATMSGDASGGYVATLSVAV